MYYFPDISLLITHYNRSRSLENLLKSFEALSCQFGGIIVSDDGSQVEHVSRLLRLQRRFCFKLVSAEYNQGLGNNINKGQDAVETPYTLYVQEDFEPTIFFPEKLKQSVEYMKEDERLDIVRYYAYNKYPYLLPFKDGFSWMHMNPIGLKYRKLYCYSDHPHLRRTSFFDKFNRYEEGLSGDKTEYKMCLSFIHRNGLGLFYNSYKTLFIQKNSIVEPSTMSRNSWKNSDSYLIDKVRNVYRQIKYNYHISILPLLKSKHF